MASSLPRSARARHAVAAKGPPEWSKDLTDWHGEQERWACKWGYQPLSPEKAAMPGARKAWWKEAKRQHKLLIQSAARRDAPAAEDESKISATRDWVEKYCKRIKRVDPGPLEYTPSGRHARRVVRAEVLSPKRSRSSAFEADVSYTIAPDGEDRFEAKRRNVRHRSREYRVLEQLNAAYSRLEPAMPLSAMQRGKRRCAHAVRALLADLPLPPPLPSIPMRSSDEGGEGEGVGEGVGVGVGVGVGEGSGEPPMPTQDEDGWMANDEDEDGWMGSDDAENGAGGGEDVGGGEGAGGEGEGAGGEGAGGEGEGAGGEGAGGESAGGEGEGEGDGGKGGDDCKARWEAAGLYDAGCLCVALGLVVDGGAAAVTRVAFPEEAHERLSWLESLLTREDLLSEMSVLSGDISPYAIARCVRIARNAAELASLKLQPLCDAGSFAPLAASSQRPARKQKAPPAPPAPRRRTRVSGTVIEIAEGDEEKAKYINVYDNREAALAQSSVFAWRALGVPDVASRAMAMVGASVCVLWAVRGLRGGGVEHRRASTRAVLRKLLKEGFSPVELKATIISYEAPFDHFVLKYEGESSKGRECASRLLRGEGFVHVIPTGASASCSPAPDAATVTTTATAVSDPFMLPPSSASSLIPPLNPDMPRPEFVARARCTSEDVAAYQAALDWMQTGTHCCLQRVLDSDLYAELERRLGDIASEALALHDECMHRLAACRQAARPATLKCMGLFGAAIGLIAGLSQSEWAKVALMETSTMAGMQKKSAKTFFGAPRSENSFELTYSCHRKASREALLAAGDSDCSVHGEVTQALTQQLLRALDSPARRATDLSALSREQLGEMVCEAWAATCAARPVAIALAPWLAYFHDAAQSNPLKGSIAEGLFQFNGWAAHQAESLLLDVEEMEVVDFCSSYSCRGRSEISEISALFGVTGEELVRRNAALTMQFVLAATDEETVIYTNWDSETYHEQLWWAMGGVDKEQAWCGLPGLTLSWLRTIGKGYGGGATRMMSLGLH